MSLPTIKPPSDRLVVALAIVALSGLVVWLSATGANVPEVVLGFLFGSGLTSVLGFFFTASPKDAPAPPAKSVEAPPP